MISGVEKKLLWPAILMGVLAIFLSIPTVQAQTVKDMPPPPPLWKPKPTPTPKPPEQEVLDVVKVTSNLVMVPVSVTDQQGQAVQGLQKTDFRLEEEGKQQEISELGNKPKKENKDLKKNKTEQKERKYKDRNKN
jgi:hypothetical protein